MILTDWQEKAECIGKGTEYFYADNLAKNESERKEIFAKNICRQCPVAAECLLHAFENEETFGIWGSFLPKERNAILNLFHNIKIDINLCKQIVNKEIKSIRAMIMRNQIKVWKTNQN